MNDFVKIVEVGPRDGLQNEKIQLRIEQKRGLILDLIHAGLRAIEVGSCVSAQWVPQMADSAQLFAQLAPDPKMSFSLLTPNLKGLEQALAVGCKEVAVFTAASESFTQKNINCSIAQSLSRFSDVLKRAQQHDVRVRAYVSCIVDCPYQGAVAPEQVAQLAKKLYELGCYEISLGETIGTATPDRVARVWDACLKQLPAQALAGHFHNSYGMAIANIYQSLQHGIRIFDSSIAGIGGCPYANGASGNVATEDLVYLLHGMHYQTGVDMDALMRASKNISAILERPSQAHSAQAYWQNCHA
jgi:hydroxymethylglutaryl-CoA lyase